MRRSIKSRLKWFLFISISTLQFVLAEGTKQLKPAVTDFGAIKLRSSISGDNTTFALLNGPENHRLNVFCNPGETVYMGFKAGFKVQVTVKAPDGSIAFQLTDIPGSGKGAIASYAQAVAGPIPVAGNSGYDPFTFKPLVQGNYSIEFKVVDAIDDEKTVINFLDVTVVDQAARVRNGRLWSKAWEIATEGGNNQFNGSVYVYTTDQIVTKVNMNGLLPNEFVISANNSGTTNSGDPISDRKSKKGVNQTLPIYQIFLNDPDSIPFPSGKIGALVGKPFLSGCPGNYCINIEVTAAGEGFILMDLNGQPGFQENTSDRSLQHTLVKGTNCIPWDGKDGVGNVFTQSGSIAVNIKYANGMTHIPMYDVESNPNGYKVEYVRPRSSASTSLNLYWDDTAIPGGNSNTVLPCIGDCHTWPTKVGNENTLNTWWFVAESSADLDLDLLREIDANINTPGKGKANDTLFCATSKSIMLRASATQNSRIKWSSLNGEGFFQNDTLLTTFYHLTKKDSVKSSVTLIISTVGGNCPPLKDTIVLHLKPVPPVTGTTSKSEICIGDSVLVTAGGATTYQWSDQIIDGKKFAPLLTKKYTVKGQTSGCSDTASVLIIVHAVPVVIASTSKSEICPGDSVKLSGSGALSYLWDQNVTDQAPFVPTQTATYTVTGIDKYSCQDTARVLVKVVALSGVTASATSLALCEGDSVKLTGGGAQNYTWDKGVVNNVYLYPLSTTTYLVKGFAGNCFDTASITITVHPKPLTPKPQSVVYCVGDVATSLASLTGNIPGTLSFFTYQNTPVNGSLIPSTNNNDAIYYKFNTTDINGCMSDSSEIKIQVNAPPSAGIIKGISSICEGMKEKFSVQDVKSSLPLQYKWTAGTEGAIFQFSQDSIASYLFSSNASGTILSGSFTVEASNTCGKIVLQHQVALRLKPRAVTDTIAGINRFCELELSQTYSILPQPQIDTYTWTWNNQVQTTTQPTLVLNQSQWKSISSGLLTVVPENSCGKGPVIQKTLYIKQADSLFIQLTSDKKDQKFCRPTDPVLFTAIAQNTNATAFYTFYVDGVAVQQSNSLQTLTTLPAQLKHKSEIYVNLKATGCYWNPSQNSSKLVMNAFEKPDSVISVLNGTTSICEEGEGPVVLTTSDGSIYEWFRGNTSMGKNATLSLSRPSESGHYHFIAKNGICKDRRSADTLVRIYEMPHVTFGNNPLIISPKNPSGHVMVTGTGLSRDTLSHISWTSDTWLSNAHVLEPTARTTEEERRIDYLLEVKTGNEKAGCRNAFPYTIINTRDIRIPNAFSPNNDGLNDTWVLEGILKYPSSHVFVYNRWGGLVYQNKEGYPATWNGQHHGNDLPAATYYYVVELKGSPDNTDHPETGSLTIIR